MMTCTLTRCPGFLEEKQPHNITQPPPCFTFMLVLFMEILETWQPEYFMFPCYLSTVIFFSFYLSRFPSPFSAGVDNYTNLALFPGNFVTVPVDVHFLLLP